MNQLVPCPSCRRHITTNESRCPFCENAVELGSVPLRPVPRERLSRAAAFTFGATVVGILAGACGGATEEPPPGPENGGMPPGTAGSQNSGPVYGAPVPGTAGAFPTVAGSGGTGGGPMRPMGSAGAPVYGAPPALGGYGGAIYGAPIAGTPNVNGGAAGVYGAPIYGAPIAGVGGESGGAPAEGGAPSQGGAGSSGEGGESGAAGGPSS